MAGGVQFIGGKTVVTDARTGVVSVLGSQGQVISSSGGGGVYINPSTGAGMSVASGGKAPSGFIPESLYRNLFGGKGVTLGSSSGGGGLITDNRGNIVGIDTGKQSRLLTPAEKEVYSRVNRQNVQQTTYFQNLVNQGRMSPTEANRRLQGVMNTYQRDIIARRNIQLQRIAPQQKMSFKERIVNLPQRISETSMEDIKKTASKLKKSKIPLYKLIGKIASSEKVMKPYLAFQKRAFSGTIELPYGVIALIKNPKMIKDIPKNTINDIKDTIKLIRTSPSEGVAKIGADVFSFVILGKTLKITGKYTSKVASKINSKFYKVAKIGTDIPIQLKDGTIKLKIVGKIPTESFAKQVGRAGTKVSAISSQADNLVGLIKRKRIVMKPLGIAERKLTPTGKILLKKFDAGTISSRQLIKLDRLIKRTGSKGILERSFFADPSLRVRPSRLGIKGVQSEATFKELLSGKATLRKAKPQILLFEDVRIQNIPKSLKSIKNKLRTGRTLTSKEAQKFLSWQQKKTGKFKPVGFMTRESEITLAPGEILKRQRKVATILVKGKKVPIISTKVVQPTRGLRNLLKKANIGKISSKEIKQLSRKLNKESGFKYSSSQIKKSLSSSYKTGAKYFPIKRKISSVGLSGISRGILRKKVPSSAISKKIFYTSRGTPYIKTKSGARFISPIGVSPRGRKYYPSYPSVKSIPKSIKGISKGYYPIKPLRYFPKARGRKIRVSRGLKRYPAKSSPLQTFNVYGKSGKKFIKLNTKPLRKIDALSRGTFAIDHTTSKSFKIIPAGKRKKFGALRKSERNYFNRAGYKLREFKVRRGRAFQIKPRYIERTRYGIDTRGEKRGLTIAKFVRQQRRGTIHTGKYIRKHRRITPMQRRIMLKNLAKARRVLARRRKR